MFQLDGRALVFGQLGKRLGKAQQLFVASRLLAGRRLLRRQPGLQMSGGLFQRGFQRALVTFLATAELAQRVGQVPHQDFPQPAEELRVGLSAELAQGLMRLQQRLLHHVRRVESFPQPRIQLQRSQQVQILTMLIQRPRAGAGFPSHEQVAYDKRRHETGKPGAATSFFRSGSRRALQSAGPYYPASWADRKARSMAETLTLDIPNLDATMAFGRCLAGLLFPGAVVALVGPLGAGKTHLVRAVAEGLGISDSRVVNSPTFVL